MDFADFGLCKRAVANMQTSTSSDPPHTSLTLEGFTGKVLPSIAPLLWLLLVSIHGPFFDTTAIAQALRNGEPTLAKKTFTYKVAGDVRIEADVYQPNDLPDRPVLAWFHGGALMMGHRRDVPKQFL